MKKGHVRDEPLPRAKPERKLGKILLSTPADQVGVFAPGILKLREVGLGEPLRRGVFGLE